MLRTMLVVLTMAVMLGLAAACGSNTEGNGTTEGGDGPGMLSAAQLGSSDPSGIQVWGRGVVAIEPDMALLSLGVESRG